MKLDHPEFALNQILESESGELKMAMLASPDSTDRGFSLVRVLRSETGMLTFNFWVRETAAERHGLVPLSQSRLAWCHSTARLKPSLSET